MNFRKRTLHVLCAVCALAPLTVEAQPGGRRGLAPNIDRSMSDGRDVEVDSVIASSVAEERVGRLDGALAKLEKLVLHEGERSAKAHYFLARALGQSAEKAESEALARSLERRRLKHLRRARELARRSHAEEQQEWGRSAEEQLRRRSRSTPLLNQYGSGSYPGGYCAPTSLRMLLRLEGLKDPGADAVALRGARPYRPGAGSDGFAVARRASELGLKGARFTKSGSLEEVLESIDAGRPAAVAGIGPYRAQRSGGGTKARRYDSGHWLVAVDYERDAAGRVSAVVLNDPDGGVRVRMTLSDFKRFFAPDGKIWTLTYGG